MESIILPAYKKGDETDCSKTGATWVLSTTDTILSDIHLSRLVTYAEEIIGVVSVDFDVTGELLIIYSAFVKC